MCDGRAFLRLNGVERVKVSGHALARMREHMGRRTTEEEAFAMFLDARQITPETVLGMGYRIAYGRRKRKGEESWYFVLPGEMDNLVAVAGRGREDGGIIWVTTLAPSRQSELFRAADNDPGTGVPRLLYTRPARPGKCRGSPRRGRRRSRERARKSGMLVPEILEYLSDRDFGAA